jgi:hypothetical protein
VAARGRLRSTLQYDLETRDAMSRTGLGRHALAARLAVAAALRSCTEQ